MEIVEIPPLRAPILIASFGGWNDAGEAATGALNHLLNMWDNTLIAAVDPEDFYDYQVNRPQVSIDDSKIRHITWPGTQIFGVQSPSLPFDLVIAKGVEPSMRWKSFSGQILDLADDLEVSMIVTLGALLADTPHTRPITVTGSGSHPDVAKRLGMNISRYQGPTGILGILQDGAQKRGIDAVSLWASIPHYASSSPSPKATLALVNSLEDFLNVSIDQGDLPDHARAWEIAVDEMASEDSDIAEYIKTLEASKDETELPEASGESIAREFERYLRRKNTE